ncbi:ligand-binding sensor domain-containing protein [Carboxylicivirga marina]|uniref:ligand-binding sensor domain-containing protein n=1 Tax=Carboxylicivirga marina TaxID=2800988 RepID=UPI0025952388|nr:sensor histidine kinase [uncultured Carboxylicivirga sp.]
MIYRIALIASLLIGVVSLSAQVKRYTSYSFTIDDGLSQNSVGCFLEDKRGFIWFGTEDGLNRFDGVEVTVFSTNDGNDVGLVNNSISCLIEDQESDLIYIGTNGGGLSVFDPKTEYFIHYQYNDAPNSIVSSFVYDMCQDEEGNVILATSHGVSVFNPTLKIFNNYESGKSRKDAFPFISATSVVVGDEEHIWVGTYGEGLILLNTKERSYKQFKIPMEATLQNNCNIINTIKWSSNHQELYLATDGGFYAFNPSTNELRLLCLNDVTISDFEFDAKGGIWISSGLEGLTHLHPDGKVEQFKNDPFDIHSLKENYLRDLYIDSRGHLWVGTKSSGCIHIDISDNQFVHYYQTKDGRGLNGSSVYAIESDEDNNVWIGTMKGLSLWHSIDEEILQYHPFNTNEEISVWSLLYQANVLWIGTSKGLIKHNVKTKDNIIYKSNADDVRSLPDNEVFAIEEGMNGALWIGTAYGLAKFDREKGTFKRYAFVHKNESTTNEMIWDIHLDRKNRLWVTSQYGINIYKPDTDEFVYLIGEDFESSGLANASVHSVYEDSSNNVWLATDVGIYQLDEDLNVVRHYGIKEGLKNQFVYRVLEHKKKIWISTNKGLSKIDLENDKFVSYDVTDGLQSNEFNAACECLPDGRFLYGGINGVNIFHPDSIVQSSYNPPIYYTSLELYGHPITVRDSVSLENVVMKNSVIYANNLYFDSDERFFTINFAALDYEEPSGVEYYYRMLPNSTDWIPLNKKRNLTFIDLNDGEYELQVKSTNAAGYLCDNAKSINIIVKPPFWKEPWVIITSILIIIVLVYLAGRLYYLRVRRDKEVLEKRVEIRTKEIQLQRNIAHRQRDEIARQKEEIESFAKNLEVLVGKRTEELKQAKEAAEESDRLKSAFLSNMSHEIRTPMNAIMGFSELLLDSAFSNEEKNDFAHLIRTNGDNLLHLLNDIIDISMIESGQMKIAQSNVDISELLTEVFKSFKTSTALENKQDFVYELICSEEHLHIDTDAFRLRQVLNNLISNALKFTPKGYVRVSLSKEGNFARFSVEDSGIGINLENQKRIFDRFLKIENQNADLYAGNGLGLTITKNIVELLNGKIGVESELGLGTNFYFYLPLKPLN